jgi:hypothetical protein
MLTRCPFWLANLIFTDKFFNDFTPTHFTDGSETQQNIRAKRAKKPRTPGASAVVPEPDQRLDNDQSEDSSPVIPTGFLSPSVKEYLELGKSIPGKKSLLTINFNFVIAKGARGGRKSFALANKL